MSWKHDYDLSYVLKDLKVAAAFGDENRLVALFNRHKNDTNTNEMLTVVTPMHPSVSMCMATSCSFESTGIFDIYLQWTLSGSTAITITDFTYWGRLNALAQNDHSPPNIHCYCASAISFGGAPTGLMHIVTKDGWNIGGISYPSILVTGGIY